MAFTRKMLSANFEEEEVTLYKANCVRLNAGETFVHVT